MEFEQLVIKLKPTELADLRTMAQAADSDSLEDFVTQKVLSLLAANLKTEPASIDSELQTTSLVSIDGAKWEQVISDLSRLRQELGVFAKESAFNFDDSPSEPMPPSANSVFSEPVTADPSEPEQISAGVENKSAAANDPLDDLLEETLLKIQAKERPKQSLPNPIISSTKADESGEDEGNEAETREQKEFSVIEPVKNELLEDVSDSSVPIFKESPFDRSGGFPPKKRKS